MAGRSIPPTGQPSLLLSRRLLWRRRDGAVIRPDWAKPADRIQFPIRFFDVLFVLEVMAEMGRLDDPRCAEALDLLESKRLSDGGFPLEERIGTTRPVIASRGTFADWGPSGTGRSNPLVTVAALGVLRRAGRLHNPPTEPAARQRNQDAAGSPASARSMIAATTSLFASA